MAKSLLHDIGSVGADNLVSGTLIPMKTVPVLLKGDAGGIEYKRGQLLTVDAEGNASIPEAAATTVEAVLFTDDIGKITDDTPAAAAVTGEFNENVVLWGEIPEANQPAVKQAAAEHQLYLAPQNQAPYVES